MLNFWRELRPAVKVVVLVLLVAIPIGIFALTNTSNKQAPAPASSPDITLGFPIDTTTTSTTIVVTTTLAPATTPVTAPQCSDGRDNDRDGKIDLKDPGCSSRSDRSEVNAVVPTPRCTPRTYPLAPSPCPPN